MPLRDSAPILNRLRILLLSAALTLPLFAIANPVPTVNAPRGDESVTLRAWLVAGPLPSPDLMTVTPGGPRRIGYDRDYLTAFGGETSARITPGADVEYDGGTATFVARSWESDYLDLTEVYGNDARVLAYLYAELRSAETRDVYVHVGTNDAGKAWVGGELVVAHPRDRGARPSQNIARVTIQAGITPILLKIDQAGGGWGAYVSLLGPEAHESYVREHFPRRLAVGVSNAMPLSGDTVSIAVANVPDWPGIVREFSWTLEDPVGEASDLPGGEREVSLPLTEGATRDVKIVVTTPHPGGGDARGELELRVTAEEDAYFLARHRPDHVVLSLGDGEQDRRVAWRTNTATTASVAEILATSDAAPDWSAARSVTGSNYEQDSNRGLYRAHEATFAGLAPGTRYAYRVGDGSPDGWSAPYTFALPDPEQPLRVVVLGDSRSNMEAWGDVIAAAAEHDPAFIVSTGDLIGNGRDMNDWNMWFEEAKDVFPSVPFMPTLGNHENSSPNYLASFALPRNASREEWAEQFYSVDAGPSRWLGMNSELHLAQQAEWLDTVLADAGPRWVFAAFHRPAYSGSKSRGEGNLDIRRIWSPGFDVHGVAVAWQGHDHFYLRTKSISGEEIVEHGAGTIYVTAGGAGAPLYDIETNRWTEYAEKAYHYVVLDITPERVEATVYRRPDGAVIDRFELTRGE